MKCTVIADNLKKAISLSERSAGKDATLPILSSFLLSAEKGALRITTTNLEVGLQTSVRSSIQDQGRVAIPVKIFSSFISTIPKDEKVTLESKGHDLIVVIGEQKTLFKGFTPEDFPPFPVIRDLYSVTFQKSDLSRVLMKSLVSISKSTIKPELASVYIALEKEMAVFASTDSFRLSEERMKPLSFSIKSQKESFLLPLRTSEEILRLIEYSDEDQIRFLVGKGEVLIQHGETSLYSRLTEGSFPDYQQIIPKKFNSSVTVDRNLFIAHIRRASLFTNKLNGISLAFLPESGECVIESSNRDVGEYKSSIPVEIKGSGVSIVFNYHYLIDGIESFSDNTLFFGFNSEAHPLVIHPAKREESLYIVMPMKGVV